MTEIKKMTFMYCSDYESTECGIKLCCYDCNNKQCDKKCELEKDICDYLWLLEPSPTDEQYTED